MNDATRPSGISRRQLLTTSLAGLAGGAASGGFGASEVAIAAERGQALALPPRRVLRFAHLTDVHVQADQRGEEGFAAALQHVQKQDDAPAFVMFGGDNVMNVDSRNGASKADEQLAIWRRCLKNELSLPSYTCIGNHDVLRMEPIDGKQWAVDAYGLESRYYSFDHSGWRFIVLDSTSPEEGGYKGRLDETQWEWLQQTVAATPHTTPIIVVSHIPILGACAYFDGDNEKSGNWVVPGAWMHVDARAIKELFRQHPQVRVALSGHIHLVDEVRYNQVSYYCNGAVSGGWWRGNYQEFEPGYALIDLFEDGSSQRQFVTYDWPPKS